MADETKQRIHRALSTVQRRYEGHGRLFRVLWVLAGLLVISAGLVMTVVPGPAIVVIPVGLAMLAAVFQPVRHLVELSIDAGLGMRNRMQHHRAAIMVAAGIAALGIGVAAFLLLA